MALRVWLPLNGNLNNYGLSETTFTTQTATVDDNGKIGKCYKVTSQQSLGYIPNFNNKGLSLCGWFKFNKSEINAITSVQTYDSTYTTCTGNLIGNDIYGGIGLIWQTNNIYSSGSLTSINIRSALRTPVVGSISTLSFNIEFDTWIYITLTWDPNTHVLSLYKDGVLVHSRSNISAFTDGVSRELYINYQGVYTGNAKAPAIPIYENDIRVYDHALSPKEVYELSKGLILHYKLNQSTNSTIYDCSGYQNNGAITGEFSILSDSKRYKSSIKYLNSDTSIAIGNLSQLCPAGIFTFNIWFKKNTGEWSTKLLETIFGGPGISGGFELDTKIRSGSSPYIHTYSWGGGDTAQPNDYSIPYTLDEWHMLTMVRTASYSKFYLDGELKVTGSAGSIPSGNYYLGAWNTEHQQNYRGYLSDFRIYATELSESDILSLYQTSASIDNQQNFYSYEIEDNSTEYSGGLINSGEVFDQTFRATNNGLNVQKDIGIELAHLQNVKGNTVAWNQLVNKNTSGGFQAGGLTGSFNNGVWTYSGMPTSTAIAMLPRGSWGKVSSGHKYFLSAVGTTSSGNIRWVSYGGTNEILNKAVGIKRFDNNSNDLEPVIANLTIGTAFSASLSYLVIDLTLIYGAGNEPTTPEQFEADYQKWFGKPLTYEPYNAGELIPAKTTALKTTGFNQWDEEWEVGTINTSNGYDASSSVQIRNPGNKKIAVIPNTSYCIKWHVNRPTGNFIYFYRADGTYIGYNNAASADFTVFTTPSDCAYLRFVAVNSESTYANDICINLSHSGTRNGEYEPYESHTLQLPLTTLTGKLNGAGESVVVFPDGMKKAGLVQDEIYVSGGKTYAVKRVGGVDLGSLYWVKGDGPRLISYGLDAKGSPTTVIPNIINSKYVATTSNTNFDTVNNVITLVKSQTVNIYISDSSYTDGATFKAAMQGIMLYYELATPLVYELDDFTLPQRFKVNDYGMEEQISNTTSIPAELLISYDIKDKISLIGNETIYGDMIPIESGTYNYSYKYEVVGSNNLFQIGLEYYDTNRNLLSTANQVSSTGAQSEKVTSGNVSIPANTKYVRYKIVNDANNNSTSNTSTIYFISLRQDTANPLQIYSTGESICNEFIELDQTSIHDSGITETNNIYEI